MNRYMYFCSKCHFFGSAETESPDVAPSCPKCTARMVYMGYDKPAWDAYSPEEKAAVKQTFIQEAEKSREESNSSDAVAERIRNGGAALTEREYLAQCAEHLSTIKKCVVFFTVLQIIAMVIAFIAALCGAFTFLR